MANLALRRHDGVQQVQWDPSGLSQWGIAMIVLSSVAVACLLLIIVIRIGQYCTEEAPEGTLRLAYSTILCRFRREEQNLT